MKNRCWANFQLSRQWRHSSYSKNKGIQRFSKEIFLHLKFFLHNKHFIWRRHQYVSNNHNFSIDLKAMIALWTWNEILLSKNCFHILDKIMQKFCDRGRFCFTTVQTYDKWLMVGHFFDHSQYWPQTGIGALK